MVVPRWFKEALRAINPRLSVKWNHRAERWIVLMDKGDEMTEYDNNFALIDAGAFNKLVPTHRVMGSIQTPQGGFAPLSREVLNELRGRFCHYAKEVQEPTKLEQAEKDDAEFRASVRDWHKTASRKSLTASGGDRI